MNRSELPPTWRSEPDLCCVVLAAGRGSRAYPLTQVFAKSMVPVCQRPLLDYTLHYWRPVVSRFVFVVNHMKEMVIDHVTAQGVPAAFVVQRELRGIAHALALCRPLVGRRFVVVLGDCLCCGLFRFPRSMDLGVGVQRVRDPERIRRSYRVRAVRGVVREVEEKPANPARADLLGLGYYFFTDDVFPVIERTPPSALRGEVEITDVVAALAAERGDLRAVEFEGEYLNLNFPDELERFEARNRVLAETFFADTTLGRNTGHATRN
jgi:dTDP-glucose pyrophosphorylase